MQTTTADKWDRVRAAWLWTECGEGHLLPVRNINADWWIATGSGLCGMSWCCHPGTTLYIGTPEEAKGQERVLRDDLAARRARWNATPAFDERHCSGAYDGNRVISDADPGL